MALPPSFVTGTQTAGFVPTLNAPLQDRLRKSSFRGAFLHMGIALADLTQIAEDPDRDSPFSVPFGGANLDLEMAVFSLAKIAAMFAAFRLRERVRLAAAAVGSAAKNADEMVEKIASEWKPLVSAKISKPPQDFPDLKHIFDFGPASPWNPKFKDGGRDWKALTPFHESATAATLEFMDRMRLMIRFSDNLAAGSCVRDIGFQYMNGALADDGFSRGGLNGILWLGGDYGFKRVPPIMGAPDWDHGQGATWVRANAKGIASFLTFVWTNRLVKQAPSASGEMRDILLERPGVGFGTNLRNSTPNVVRAWSKVGLGSNISEGVIIECNTGSGLIRYAGVGLGGRDNHVMKKLAGIFFDVIKALH
jgi:Beta-lactamase enzyme family